MSFFGRRRIESTTKIHFGHERREEQGWEQYPLRYMRPQNEQHPYEHELVCQGCRYDAPAFVLRVHSARAARMKRYLWLLGALGACAIIVIGIVSIERIRESFPIVIGFCMLLYFLHRWWNEDGVTVLTPQRDHRLMWK